MQTVQIWQTSYSRFQQYKNCEISAHNAGGGGEDGGPKAASCLFKKCWVKAWTKVCNPKDKIASKGKGKCSLSGDVTCAWLWGIIIKPRTFTGFECPVL